MPHPTLCHFAGKEPQVSIPDVISIVSLFQEAARPHQGQFHNSSRPSPAARGREGKQGAHTDRSSRLHLAGAVQQPDARGRGVFMASLWRHLSVECQLLDG
jgi:hypothetical protein